MTRSATIAAILLALGIAGRAGAAQQPRAGTLDQRVTSVTYRANDVVEVVATHGISTMIVFDEDERFETIALGDSDSWQVAPAERGNILFVKPVAQDVTTNMNVVTDKRIYHLELRDAAPEAGTKTFAIRFLYPDKAVDDALREEARHRAAHPNLAGIDKANLNIDYSYSGAAELKPLMVFDDGRKTFFRFKGRVPAIFAVGAGSSETLKNMRKEGDLIVVDGTALQFTLRDGALWTCLFNLRKSDPAAPDPAILGPKSEASAARGSGD